MNTIFSPAFIAKLDQADQQTRVMIEGMSKELRMELLMVLLHSASDPKTDMAVSLVHGMAGLWLLQAVQVEVASDR